jgi:hypothetical protein
MTAEEKRIRAIERTVERFKCFQIGKCVKQTALEFQKMIRAEAGCKRSNYELCVKNHDFTEAWRRRGECVCVTCARVLPWDSGEMHAGHFIGSRRNSILFEETNVHPQCVSCNNFEHGAPYNYRIYMENVYGLDEIERLQALKADVVKFDREQLATMLIDYRARLNTAKRHA